MDRSSDLCAGRDTSFQIYELAIEKKVIFPYKLVLHIHLLEKFHPSRTVLHTPQSSEVQNTEIYRFYLELPT